jgi:hypothetical protein
MFFDIIYSAAITMANDNEFHEGCENMSNEEFIEHLCEWDYTNGEGEYESGNVLLDFFLTVSLMLDQTPETSSQYQRLETKKQEIQSIYRMKNDIVNQVSDIVNAFEKSKNKSSFI